MRHGPAVALLVGVALAGALALAGLRTPAAAVAALAVSLLVLARLAEEWGWLVAALLLLEAVELLLPKSAAVLVSAAIYAVALTAAVRLLAAGRHRLLVTLVLAELALAALEIANRNLPSLSVGLLGFRKSTLALAGLLIGLAGRRRPARRVGHGMPLLLVGLLCVSIAVHVGAPAFEQALHRSSNYTDEFGGRPRMDGIVAGPFHLALIAAWLGGCAVSALLRRGPIPRQIALLALALTGLVLTQVRTGYLAFGGCVVLAVAGAYLGPVRRGLPRTVLVSLVGIVAAVLAFPTLMNGDRAFRSLFSLGTDSRATGRFGTYDDALHLIRSDPLFGWGSGSAGDTLAPDFGIGAHVTAHDVFLKYAVEQGLVGLVVVVAIGWLLARTLCRRSADPTVIAGRYALVCLLAFGLSTSIVEATPVSLFLFVLIGVSVRVQVDQKPVAVPDARGGETATRGAADARRAPRRVVHAAGR